MGVHLTSTDFGFEREIVADRAGDFLVLRLPPGEYQLRATAATPGLGTAVATVDLEGGDLAEVELQLGQRGSSQRGPASIGGGDAPSLTLANYVIPGQMSALPLKSRRWEDLAELDSEANETASSNDAGDTMGDDPDDPASRMSSSDGGTAAGLSYAGLSGIESRLSIDGLSGQQSFRAGPRGAASGGASSRSSYNQGSVRSFRILPHNFSAQYGMVGGLAMVSRTASAQLHGDAFVRLRESTWAATNPFSIETHYRDGAVTSAPVKPGGVMLLFGGSVGLPLTRRRDMSGPGRPAPQRNERQPVSLFASLEAQLRKDRIVSSPAMASFFNLSAEQIALLANRGVGAAATNSALNYLDSLTGTTARHAYRVQGSVRVDGAPTARDRMTLIYAGNRFDSPAGAALGQSSDAVVARGTGSLGDSVVQVDVGSARWLHLFSRGLNNELRTQLAHDLNYETPHAPLLQEPSIGPGGYAPQVSIAPNGFSYGTPTSMGGAATGGHRAYPDELRLEVADSTELHLGRHLLIVGGDWSRIDDRIDVLSGTEGAFSYDSGITKGKAGGLVDWITDYTFNVHAYPNGGCPSIAATVHYFCFRSFTQSFGSAATEFVTHNVAGFVEDSTQVRSNISVTFGVRYDYTLLPTPQRANAVLDGDIAAMNAPIHGATATFPEDRNNVGPRLAVAWSPQSIWGMASRKSRANAPLFTMHMGYGVFFSHIPGATVRAALTETALPATTTRIRILPKTITLCPQVTNVQQGFGYPCDYITAPPAAVAQTTSAMVFASNYRVPAVQRGMLSMERDLGRGASVRVSYLMATATQLPGSTDINIAPSAGDVSYVLQGGDGHPGLRSGQVFEVPLYGERPMAQFGAVTALVSNANATYHAFTAEASMHGLRWKGLRGLEMRGSYTFSRSIDYGAQSSATPRLDGQFDPFHNGYDKGLSNQQFPERFAGSMAYQTRFHWGPEGVRAALDGWRVAAIATAGSGAPYSYMVFGGSRLRGGHESINGSGGANYLPTVGRNTLRLAPRGNVDLRVARELRAGSRLHLEAFAEVFNLLNAQNVSSVEKRAFVLGRSGSPSSTGLPRPLIFQDALALAIEGLTTARPFGTPNSSTTGTSRERQIELGLRLQF